MNVRGIPVHFCDQGSGSVVLFLHGWGSRFSAFQGPIERTSAYYRVLALDLPGFGESGEPPEAWGVDDYADFVLAFLAELQVEEAILVGHSFGGRIAVKLAARQERPLRIPKMVLVDSAGIRPAFTLKKRLRSLIYKLGRGLLSMPFLRERRPDLLEGWRTRWGSADYRDATPRMRECLVKVVNEDLTPCLPQIPCPTLLVWGEHDTATPVADARIMEKLIPDAGLVVLKNAGHYSFLDQSYAFGRILDSFLNIDRREPTGHESAGAEVPV